MTGLKTIKNWDTRQSWPSGHYNPHDNIVVKYKGKEYELESGHGTRDDVTVFRLKGTNLFYVVCVNTGLPYVGVALYDLEHYKHVRKADDETVKPSSEVFLQESYQVEESLGKDGERLHPRTIVNRLDDYLMLG